MKLSINVVIILFSLISNLTIAQTVIYDSIPQTYQLYPRNEANNDSAVVTISGVVVDAAETYDSMTVDIDTSGISWQHSVKSLVYNDGTAPFSFHPKIYADTVEFRFRIRFWENGRASADSVTVDSVVCGDVYLIQGQSNAVAEELDNLFEPYTSEWVRSFGLHAGTGSAWAEPTALDTNWGLAHAAEKQTHAYVGIWGLRLGKLIAETHGKPVCVINGAPGGTPIKSHVRNDSDPDDLETIYGRLLWRAQKAGVDGSVKALIWWQGEGNTGTEALANQYVDRFPGLRDDWKTDYDGIRKIYTTQLHVGHGDFANQTRNYQRLLAEVDSDTTEIMSANHIGGFVDNDHFTSGGYEIFADRIFKQISRDFYGDTDTVDVDPPKITRAYFANSDRNILILEFDNTETLVWPNDTLIGGSIRSLNEYFYFHHEDGTIDTSNVNDAMIFSSKLRLVLDSVSNATKVTYLPNRYYNEETIKYEGPWLVNSRGVPALSFFEFAIDNEIGDDPLPVTLTNFSADFLNGMIQLKWRTESEINNLGFVVLKKEQNESGYRVIASYENNPALKGKGTTSQANEYEYADSDIVEGQTYYYLLQDVDYNGVKTNHGPLVITAVESAVPLAYRLYQNYPNPFNPETTISFFIPQPQLVTLRVFDTLGRTMDTLINQKIDAGYHIILYKPTNLASGIYYYQIRTEDFSATKRMSFVK